MNEVLNISFLENSLHDSCASLIIADPPYYEVKGEFDFNQWASFDEYLKDVEQWAKECKRLLKPNGTLIWWGHALKIAYTQVILDKYFSLLNSGVWEKKDTQVNKTDYNSLRSLAPVTERFLLYENYNQSENDWKNNNASVYFEGFEPIRLWLKDEIDKFGGAIKLGKAIGVSSRAIGHWKDRSQWYFPSDAMVAKCQALGVFTGSERVREEYDRVREEYASTHRRAFNNSMRLNDVIKSSQEAHITGNYAHPTQKPETLTRQLILTATRKGDLVVVPFAGSGTECAMSAKEGRDFIGFDINSDYCRMAKDRCNVFLKQKTLF